ncbi:hypothetical protein C2U69_23110 [Cupriavidus pinatubonensis]|nr:hypothetical protein C2U69_23110 [Cupriavidus pinatubonensis]
MNNEGYRRWRRRWLRLHSRFLLASALTLAEVELDTYLKEKRTTYRDFGDFTENEIDFIFQRVCRGIQRWPAPHIASQECVRRARKRIQELGRRLTNEATWQNDSTL